MNKESTKYRRDLRRIFTNSFNLADVRVLSYDLGINWDELRGETLQEKAQALIQYLGKRGRLQDLIDLGKEERPKIDWPLIPDADQQIEDQKADISDAERRVIFDNLIDKIGPLANNVMQIKSLVEANISHLNTSQTGVLVRLLASASLTSYVKLDSVILENEDLEKIILSSRKSSLFKANLSGANLRDADLREADLGKTKLSHANLSGANLYRADLTGADLSHAKLINADLSHAKLIDANLSNAQLSGTNLYGADLSFAKLPEANLAMAVLVIANLNNAYLFEANLYRADLSYAKLRGTKLSNAKLNRVDLSEAEYDKYTQWPASFDPVAAGAIKYD